ncbi:MAG: YIP1 family protein [Candidatus Hydrothermarchaeota archaeon]
MNKTLVDKMIRAARLDISLYEEVEKDPNATKEAFLVVVIASVCGGIGSITAGGIAGLILGIIMSVIGWAMWAGIIYLIGVVILKHTSDMGELLRCLGFADSPGVLNIFGIIPFLGGLIRFVVSIWLLVAFVIAVRQALDVDTVRAIVISIIGFFVYLILLTVVFGAIFGALGPMAAATH